MARLEGQVQISIAEARKKTTELQAVVRQNDEVLRDLREENANLKEKHDQSQYQLKEVKKCSLPLSLSTCVTDLFINDLMVFVVALDNDTIRRQQEGGQTK